MNLDLSKLLQKYATDEVLEGIAVRHELYEDYDGANWIRNPSKLDYFERWMRSELSEYRHNETMKNRFGFSRQQHPDQYHTQDFMDKGIEKIKATYKYVYDFREYLMGFQNFVHLFSERTQIESSEVPFIQNVINVTKTKYPNWIALKATATCNRWCHDEQKRVQHSIDTWTLKNIVTKTYADFHTGSLHSDGILNLMMFEVVDESRHGNGLRTRQEFKDVANILMFEHPNDVIGFTSICLIEDHPSHSVTNGTWRFDEFDDDNYKSYGENINRLTRFWLSYGACLGSEIYNDTDRLRVYFWSNKKALEVREIADEHNLPNPFRGTLKSIYDKEIEKVLTANPITTDK